VHLSRILQRDHTAQSRPVAPGDAVLFQNLQQLLTKIAVEDGAIGSKRFQTIPFDWVVTGSNLQTAGGFVMLYQDTAGWSCTDSGIQHVAASCQQSGNYGVVQHGAGRTTVSGQYDFATTEHGSQSGCETAGVDRIKAVTNDTAEP